MENVNCPISENAKHTPDHHALISEDRSWTYQELDSIIHSLCSFLKSAGIKEYERVAFIAESSAATIFLFFALFRLRAIACPLSFRLPQDQIPKALELLKPSHVLELATLSINGDHDEPNPSVISLDQSATFLFTSGSSGHPKIVCHSFGNHYYNALGAILPLGLNSSSRWLRSLPLFHVSGIGILFRCFIRGATVILANRVDLDTISEFKISHLSFVPTQLYRLLKEPVESLEKIKHSLKCILLGGAPLPRCLLKEAQSHCLAVFTTYGMTEMGSIITLSDVNSRGDSGKVVPYRDLKIEKDHEIWVGGKTLFQGYWDSFSETILKADQEGWFPTKDLGRWTDDHHLEVIGRKDRQFISGGENIQPEAIEQALCSLPGIRQASVLPITEAEFGERPIAFIDDETGRYSLDCIREALCNHLPSFMHPVHVFPYPMESGIKPNLAILKQHLSQILKLSVKNRE
jgi:o-succinylbenzoate---CoA ligase